MQLDEVYISLIVRHLKKEASESEKKKLFEWVYSNSEHEKIYYHLKDIWETSRYNEVVKDASSDKEWEKFALKAIERESALYLIRQKNTRRLYRIVQYAAVLIVAIGVGFFINSIIPQKQELVSVNVPYGAKTDISLPDGSKVWINAGSKLTYPTSFKAKEIDLKLEGEAYFEITSNPKRRINVSTSTINIQVLGTTFNVKSYSDEEIVEATLVKGLISVTGEIGDKVIEPILLKPNEQVTLLKGEQKISVGPVSSNDKENENTIENRTDFPKSEPILRITGKVDTEPITSWKDNVLTFRSERFEDLARKMERWYDVQFVIKDKNLLNKKYTGSFHNETIEQAMKALSLSLPFTYEIQKNKIVVQGNN